MGVSFFINDKNARRSSIVIDVTVDGTRIRLRTGIQIETMHWDAKKCFVKAYQGKNVTTNIIRKLREMELSVMELVEQYKYGKPKLSYLELEEKLNELNDNPKTNFNKDDILKIIDKLSNGFCFVSIVNFGLFGFTKELIRRIGMLDETFLFGEYEDNDFALRLNLLNIILDSC